MAGTVSARRLACVDVGSTFTKGLLIDLDDGQVCGRAAVPTTSRTDVLEGVEGALAALGADPGVDPLVCSSAGGGLRLAVIGYEGTVTALAGHRVGLSAGARVVHVATGALSGPEVTALRRSRPDVLLLVGGTDGGNSEVLQHNAQRLAKARLSAPVVLAGNAEAAAECAALLRASDRTVIVADNVLPRIGELSPIPAREAIRQVFLRHVIGGKGLSRGPRFASLVQMATPDAVLRGIEVLAAGRGQDVLALDIGGATTDVYSALIPRGEDAGVRREVSPPPRVLRTVEADLGMRWSAPGILEGALREGRPLSPEAGEYAAAVAADVEHVPSGASQWELEIELANAAAVLAVRRHGRPVGAGAAPRALKEVGLLIGSGGVVRHASSANAQRVLQAVLGDHGGGWIVPAKARARVDTAYLLMAVGLLAGAHPHTAAALAARLAAQ